MKLIYTTAGGITGWKLSVSLDIDDKKNTFLYVSVFLQTVRTHIKHVQQMYFHINMSTLGVFYGGISVSILQNK